MAVHMDDGEGVSESEARVVGVGVTGAATVAEREASSVFDDDREIATKLTVTFGEPVKEPVRRVTSLEYVMDAITGVTEGDLDTLRNTVPMDFDAEERREGECEQHEGLCDVDALPPKVADWDDVSVRVGCEEDGLVLGTVIDTPIEMVDDDETVGEMLRVPRTPETEVDFDGAPRENDAVPFVGVTTLVTREIVRVME